MKYIMMIITMALVLTGCAGTGATLGNGPGPGEAGYQFGDGIASLDRMQAQYCATADPRTRAILLAALKRLSDAVPDRGACTDILTVVQEEDLEVLEQIDVESAEQDRRDALERLQGGTQ